MTTPKAKTTESESNIENAPSSPLVKRLPSFNQRRGFLSKLDLQGLLLKLKAYYHHKFQHGAIFIPHNNRSISLQTPRIGDKGTQ